VTISDRLELAREPVVSSVSRRKQEKRMNWDRVEGNWKQFKGKVKEKWGDLTDDDLDRISEQRDQLIGQIQTRYGLAKDEAEKQVDDWSKSVQ
jgi:uncharacterized protein YjbJ (UPF0337 family)